MSAFILAQVQVTDADGYAEYRRLTEPTVAQYGGRFRARGGTVEVLEGDRAPGRVVIIEFADMVQARRWYHSEEYATAREVRLKTAVSQLAIVEGID